MLKPRPLCQRLHCPLSLVFAWSQGHNHKLFRSIKIGRQYHLADRPRLRLSYYYRRWGPACKIRCIICIPQDLRKPADGDDMGQYMAPCPISFMVNSGSPTLILYRSERLPTDHDILFTISGENQMTIAVEFAFGKHVARPMTG